MKKTIFTGMATALVTPMTATGAVDYEAFGRFIEFQIENGINALIVMGTTGENATIEFDEQKEIIRFAVEKVAGRVPVIAGTGTNNTEHVLANTKAACEVGADAVLVVTPYYNKATQKGLITHFTAVADASTVPVILYNVPGRTGVSFTAETYKALAQNPKINGVKEASGNFSLLAHTRYLCGDDFYIWSGNDDQVVPMMSLGAKGVISVASNIAPEVMVKMSHLCLEDRFEEASKLQIQYMDLIDALFCEVNPIPVKAAMNLMGMEAGPLRLPLCDISDKNLAVLKASMERMGLL